jgi:hypothetical protein
MVTLIIVLVAIFLCSLIYMLPSVLAFSYQLPRRWTIFWINLLLGWSGVVHIVLMVMVLYQIGFPQGVTLPSITVRVVE